MRWTALLCFAAAASRAEPAGAQRDSTRRDTVQALKRVTVVGSRTPRTVIEVPFSVSSVSRAEFGAGRGAGLEDALASVPGVFAQTRSGSTDVRITIRGFGARGAGDRSNAGTSRGIRVLVDGIPETEPDGRTAFDLVDLSAIERVDVVRSNVSSVWGNAAGGVVNLSTRPIFSRHFGEVQQLAGSFGHQRTTLRGGVGFGLSRVYGSVTNSDFDGWREGSGASRVHANVGVFSPLNDRTILGAHATGTTNLLHVPGPLTRSQVDADPSQANATYLQRDERRHNRLGRISLSLERFGDRVGFSSMLYVNPKFLQRSERGTFRDFTRYHFGGNFTGRVSGAASASVRHTLSAGADGAYQDGAILFYGLTPQGTRGPDLRDNKREGSRNAGLFIQEEVWFSERLLLSAGARLDDVTYFSESFITPALTGTRSFRRVTPKLGVTWKVGPDRSVYASVGGGIEAPAGNETEPAGTFGQDTVYAINPLLEPIRSTTYEVGTKHIATFTDRFIHEVTYDVAGYWIDVRNEIVPYRGGRFYFTAGRARRAGLEVGTTFRAAGGITLTNAFTWSSNEYTRYRVDSVHYDPARAGAFADYSGNAVVGIPDAFFNTTLNVVPPSWRGLGVELGLQGASRYFADDANTVTVPGFTVVSAGASLNRPDFLGRMGLRTFLTVSNLLDRSYLSSAFLNPDVVNGVPVAFEPALPRNVTVSVSLYRTR